MTVCESESSEVLFPYLFKAKPSTGDPVDVHMVMPVGGKETGFFRYPKEGESILVDDDGFEENPTYYLMGYLPSDTETSNNFLTNANSEEDFEGFEEEINALNAEEGMILRYEQTGKTDHSATDVTDRYSEIGFYRRQTQWSSTDPQYIDINNLPERGEKETDFAYSNKLVENGFLKATSDELPADHIRRVMRPAIDQINIQSTGDIQTTAQHHQQLKAKRFELLVDCNDTIHTKAELSKDELPLGDNIGDDSVLHAGDAHIRAGNRVVIKAEEEIVLQVGKTVVKISDDGFDVISKIVNSNFTNAYDATFNMSGRDGVSMYGREVSITSDKSFSLGDTFGGSIASNLGVVSISGREIKAEAFNSIQHGFLVAYALFKYTQAIASGSMAVNGNVTDSQVGEYINFATDLLKDGIDLIKDFTDAWEERKEKLEESSSSSSPQPPQPPPPRMPPQAPPSRTLPPKPPPPLPPPRRPRPRPTKPPPIPNRGK
jgi:hypothetical protein